MFQKIMKKPDNTFYRRNDVVAIARELLSMRLVTFFDGVITSGIITETEAYEGISDRASHAYAGRHTLRTEVMYAAGGLAYVYLCYGFHYLFNIVTAGEGNPHAVLIRAFYPLDGKEMMLKRAQKNKFLADTATGPGKVCKLLGINSSHNGLPLTGKSIWLEDHGLKPAADEITAGKRIGIDYAGADALLPYRFIYTKYWKKTEI